MTPYPTAVKDHPVLRQSLLATVNDCHLQTAFDLRLSLAEPDGGPTRSGWSTHEQMRGRTGHFVLAEALNRMMEVGEESFGPDMAVEALNRALALRWAEDDELGALSVYEMDQTRRAVRKWARDNEFTIADVVAVEERMSIDVHYPANPDDVNDPRVVARTITGQPDVLLIDQGGRGTAAVAIDWKFTWALPAKAHADDEDYDDGQDDKISAEGYFQQRFYALLVFIFFPQIHSVTLREFYVFRSEVREATLYRWQLPDLVVEIAALAERFDRLYEQMPPSTAGFDAAQAARSLIALLDDGKRVGKSTPEVIDLREILEGKAPPPLHKVWKPTPGAHCRFCSTPRDCPIPPHARGIATAEEAIDVAGAMFKGQRVVKQASERVEAWCSANGPLRVVDGKRVRLLGHVVATRTERPSERQLAAAVAAGKDPLDLYRTKTHTRFTEYTPEFSDGDPDQIMTDDEVADAFQRAADAAAQRRGKARA